MRSSGHLLMKRICSRDCAINPLHGVGVVDTALDVLERLDALLQHSS
jgi:hypothetical protein